MSRSACLRSLLAILLVLVCTTSGTARDRTEHAPTLSAWPGDDVISSHHTGVSAKVDCGRHDLIIPTTFDGDDFLAGWTSHDLTEAPTHWRVSTTNCEDGFSTAAPTNHGLICNEAGLGYGNGWDARVVLRIDVTEYGIDPATQTVEVRWQGEYKTDSEPEYDFTFFQWNQGGTWQTLLAVDGSTYDGTTGVYEALPLDSDVLGGISYAPGDYIQGRYVELRVRFESDGAFSDEDGNYQSEGRGATALDNLTVSLGGVEVSVADFEGGTCDDCPAGEFGGADMGADAGCTGWYVEVEHFGDFAKLYALFRAIDPCKENPTPQICFIDNGTPPNNDPRSTGGEISPTWDYGVPGGYVVNYSGGVSGGDLGIWNEVWSAEIDWDLPGTEDDAATGAVLKYDWWAHLPYENGIASYWKIRSYSAEKGWSDWENYNSAYYREDPAYATVEVDVSALLLADPERIQIALGVVDLSGTGSPGSDATPSPLYDNVEFYKYCVEGPMVSVRNLELASDSFSNDGTLEGPIRFDSCRDIANSQTEILPLDCIPVRIRSLLPGVDLADPATGGVMKVAHWINPYFGSSTAGARAAGFADPRIENLVVDSEGVWDVYYYEVRGASTCAAYPVSDLDLYFFDLPDGPANVNEPDPQDEPAVFFPGDRIQYYFEVEDAVGNVTTLPADLGGFGEFGAMDTYDARFTVHGLPTRHSIATQPRILLWNDAGHRGGDSEYALAFAQAGLWLGEHYDVYTTRAPTSMQSNGLGSSGHHGPNLTQFNRYHTLVYVCGDLRTDLLSDGTNSGLNDKADDLEILNLWHIQPATPKRHFYFGDNFVSGMMEHGTVAQNFLHNRIGVDLVADDVAPEIDDQPMPVVLPSFSLGACFLTDFVVGMGCPAVTDPDLIAPYGDGPVACHLFTDRYGVATTVPMGLWWDRLENDHQKITGVFDADLAILRDRQGAPGYGIGARARLLQEILECAGLSTYPAVDTPPPSGARLVVEPSFPNPFNPRTTLRFHLGTKTAVRVKVYDLRGRVVRTLLDEIREPGVHSLVWDGRGDDGAAVSSGIYLCRFDAGGERVQQKLVLLR